MSDEIVAQASRRISDHVKTHGLPTVSIVLHGGEPLLAGPERLDRIASELRAALDPICELDLRLHTNAVRLDERFLDVFARHRVKVGVSLDGDRAANDLHRLYANGRSSFDQVIRGIELLRRRPELYAGLLCTIDVRSDPLSVFRALADLDPPRIDFLLPHATWDNPPPRPTPTAYAQWLIEIFELWLRQGCTPPVRMFQSIIDGPSTTESLGLQPSDLVVIETDGAYEQADSLKTAYDGAPATGFHVLRDDLDTVAEHTGIVSRRMGLAALCATCQACPVVDTCGGGLYAHRYRRDTGFANPSVYTADLFHLITHIRGRIDMHHHTITIGELADGFGGPQEVAGLAASQESIRRALLASAVAPETSPEAWRLLEKLDRDHPEAVRDVLAHPYVREWAVEHATAHPGYLGNIAVAAAVRAGASASAAVEVIDGGVHLPTLGLLEVGQPDIRLDVRDGRFTPEAGQVWHPTRRLSAAGISVLLEDADPFRDCHGWKAAPRLTDDEVDRWRDLFAAAWSRIETDLPRYAPALRAGLSTLTPLTASETTREISSTARHAFGAVAAALPADADILALLIVHEFQHVKMGAILDIVDLYDESEQRLFYAPWREDPRPLEGLLQGTYAHIAVTDFWRVLRHTAPDPGHLQFARWRADTAAAIERLAESGAMTQLGERFVAGMSKTVAPWLKEPVPADAEKSAAERSRHHQAVWVSPDQ